MLIVCYVISTEASVATRSGEIQNGTVSVKISPRASLGRNDKKGVLWSK